MNEEVELIPMEDGKFYMRLEDVNKSIEVATFELQQENQSLKDRIEKAIKIFEECKLLMPHEFDWGEQFENAIQKLKGDK